MVYKCSFEPLSTPCEGSGLLAVVFCLDRYRFPVTSLRRAHNNSRSGSRSQLVFAVLRENGHFNGKMGVLYTNLGLYLGENGVEKSGYFFYRQEPGISDDVEIGPL